MLDILDLKSVSERPRSPRKCYLENRLTFILLDKIFLVTCFFKENHFKYWFNTSTLTY